MNRVYRDLQERVVGEERPAHEEALVHQDRRVLKVHVALRGVSEPQGRTVSRDRPAETGLMETEATEVNRALMVKWATRGLLVPRGPSGPTGPTGPTGISAESREAGGRDND